VPPTPAEIRDVLQHILGSRAFATATRSRRFLAYVVEQTLSGHQDAVKEVVLGMEVFDRSTTFDPRIDPIVRVEAGKLRKRLQECYETEGIADSIRIEISKGSYVPTFPLREAIPASPPARHSRLRRKPAAAALVFVIVAVIAYFGARALRKPTPATLPSIAVLPFLNLSPDPSNEYFADGLAEDLTNALVSSGGIRVASRTSAFSFRGRQADAHEIGTKLRVTFLVEGSVRKEGQRLKITAQLVRTDNGYHVWSRSVERDIKDVLTVQREIAESVASALEAKITSARGRSRPPAHTATVEAFDLYLRGRHAVTTAAPAGIEVAERLFRESIAADPA
jgi:serine/threonine-protein kinase